MGLIDKYKQWRAHEAELRAKSPSAVIRRSDQWKAFEQKEIEKAMKKSARLKIAARYKDTYTGSGDRMGGLKSNPIVRSLARSGDEFMKSGSAWGNPKADNLSSLLSNGRIEGKSSTGMTANGLSNLLNQGSIFAPKKKNDGQ